MIKIQFSVEDLAAKFKGMQDEIMLVLAASMQTNRAMMFDKDGADNDKPQWAPIKFRDGRPLQNRGDLRRSMAPGNDGLRPGFGKDGILRMEGNRATIGTKLLYAETMNDGTAKMPGGVLRPVHAKALRFPAGTQAGAKGVKDGFMFRKWVKIPARPMDIITPADEREWAETVANFIGSRLSG